MYFFFSESLASSLGKCTTVGWLSKRWFLNSAILPQLLAARLIIIMWAYHTCSLANFKIKCVLRSRRSSAGSTFQHDDVPHLRPPSCPNRNHFAQPDAGHPASNSNSSCLTSESISGFKKARRKCLLKATKRARSSATGQCLPCLLLCRSSGWTMLHQKS